MKKNIVLVGMPACGKSTIGVVLAKVANKDFVDTDILIQHVEGRPLQDIIDNEGNDYFGKVEEQVLLDFDGENYVVSTGGSAIYYPEAMDKFREKGTVVYIQVSLDTILSRLNNLESRGVTLKEGQTLTDLYYERTPLYEERCDLIIDAEGLDIPQVVDKIMNELEKVEK